MAAWLSVAPYVATTFFALIIGVLSREWVFYTNLFVPEGKKGATRGSLIFIRPEAKGDHGLLVHEQTHVQQFWRQPILFNIRYAVNRHYRMGYEVEAYAAQAKCYPDDRVPVLAQILAEKYELGIAPEIAERAIRDRI